MFNLNVKEADADLTNIRFLDYIKIDYIYFSVYGFAVKSTGIFKQILIFFGEKCDQVRGKNYQIFGKKLWRNSFCHVPYKSSLRAAYLRHMIWIIHNKSKRKKNVLELLMWVRANHLLNKGIPLLHTTS